MNAELLKRLRYRFRIVYTIAKFRVEPSYFIMDLTNLTDSKEFDSTRYAILHMISIECPEIYSRAQKRLLINFYKSYRLKIPSRNRVPQSLKLPKYDPEKHYKNFN